MKYVVENGHPDFRSGLRKQSRGITEATSEATFFLQLLCVQANKKISDNFHHLNFFLPPQFCTKACKGRFPIKRGMNLDVQFPLVIGGFIVWQPLSGITIVYQFQNGTELTLPGFHNYV